MLPLHHRALSAPGPHKEPCGSAVKKPDPRRGQVVCVDTHGIEPWSESVPTCGFHSRRHLPCPSTVLYLVSREHRSRTCCFLVPSQARSPCRSFPLEVLQLPS